MECRTPTAFAVPPNRGFQLGMFLRNDSDPSARAEKELLRGQARASRADLARALGAQGRAAAGEDALRLFRAVIGLSGHRAVAAYWPLEAEFDPRPIMVWAHGQGRFVCLPVVAGPGRPLGFRGWHPGMVLEEADFGILIPPAEAETVTPDLVFTPLLAFDRDGYRLGYGGGYYDITLAALRAENEDLAVIGLGFAAQEVARVARDGFDQRLDWIVTERDAIAVAHGIGGE